MHEILDFARLPPLMHKYTIYRHGLPTDGSDNGDLVYGELFSKDCFGFTCKSMSIVYKISDAPTLKRKIVSVSSIQYPPDEVQ